MPQHVRESAICSKESTVVVADRRGMVKIWDINSGKALAEFDVQFEVRCLAISNDGQRIGVGGNDGRLLVVTKKSGKFEQILRIP
jgi:WD40 repeat protein